VDKTLASFNSEVVRVTLKNEECYLQRPFLSQAYHEFSTSGTHVGCKMKRDPLYITKNHLS